MGIFDKFQKQQKDTSAMENNILNTLSGPAKKFLDKYETEEQELTILLKNFTKGGGVEGDFLFPSVWFLAYIDKESGKAIQQQGVLSWVIPRSSNNYIHDFKDYGIYKVLVRQLKQGTLNPLGKPMDFQNRYYIVKILQKDVKEPQLEAIREEYLKPVLIQDELGTFTLNREYDWFEGEISWLGSTQRVLLDQDEDGDTANGALQTLRMLMSDASKWDKILRDYAAEQLTELANDWQDDEDEDGITKEAFAERIGTPSFHISSDGSFEAEYEDDDMFYGHWIVVYGNADGELDDANIEG